MALTAQHLASLKRAKDAELDELLMWLDIDPDKELEAAICEEKQERLCLLV